MSLAARKSRCNCAISRSPSDSVAFRHSSASEGLFHLKRQDVPHPLSQARPVTSSHRGAPRCSSCPCDSLRSIARALIPMRHPVHKQPRLQLRYRLPPLTLTHPLPPALTSIRRLRPPDKRRPLKQPRRLPPHLGLETIVRCPPGVLVPHEDVDEDIGIGVGPVGGFLAVFELEVGWSGGGHDVG